jgi:hypothetical protein
MKRFASLTALLALAGCSEEIPCAEIATITDVATTVSTGTPVDARARLNPAGCENPFLVAADLVARPVGSAATLTRVDDVHRLVPDVPGSYVVRRTLDGLTAEVRVEAIPSGGFEALPGDVPCLSVAVGERSLLCERRGAAGFPTASSAFRKDDLAPTSRLFAATARPVFADGRYFLANRSVLAVAFEEASGAVDTRAVVTPFAPLYGPAYFTLAASGARALLVAEDGRVRLVDAADAANPRAQTLPSLPFWAAVRVAVAGNLGVAVGRTALSSDSPVEIAVLDLANPAAAPVPLLAPFSWSPIAFAGNRLAVAQDRGLALYTISIDRGALLERRNEAASGSALAATAERIAVVNRQGVLVVSATDLAPRVFLPDLRAEQVAIEGDRLWVVGAGRLKAYRLTR